MIGSASISTGGGIRGEDTGRATTTVALAAQWLEWAGGEAAPTDLPLEALRPHGLRPRYAALLTAGGGVIAGPDVPNPLATLGGLLGWTREQLVRDFGAEIADEAIGALRALAVASARAATENAQNADLAVRAAEHTAVPADRAANAEAEIGRTRGSAPRPTSPASSHREASLPRRKGLLLLVPGLAVGLPAPRGATRVAGAQAPPPAGWAGYGGAGGRRRVSHADRRTAVAPGHTSP